MQKNFGLVNILPLETWRELTAVKIYDPGTKFFDFTRNTLYNVCAVPWGCSVPWGGVQYRGDILSTVGVFSTGGDIMINVGGYLEYRGGVQYRGGYHEYRGGVILSTVGDVQYRGGYHDAREGIS